jgi:hypothetical protein
MFVALGSQNDPTAGSTCTSVKEAEIDLAKPFE